MTEGGGSIISRDNILSGALDALVAETGVVRRVKPLAERTAAKERMIAEVPEEQDVWLFGYGSLMWNPAFHYRSRAVARIHGWRRSFSFWSTSGRGTPEAPGLMLALERGGSCHGILFRIPRAQAHEELQSVFTRELMTDSYYPRWVTARGESGAVRAISFVANRSHPNYAGIIPVETAARYIAQGAGMLGRCADYLTDTVRHLEELGIEDRYLARLAVLVQTLSAGRR